MLAALIELRIGLPHDVHHSARQPVDERLMQVQETAVPRRPAEDPAQDIAPAFIGGHGAVGDGEGQGADVIGDDPHRGAQAPVGFVPSAELDDLLDDRAEQVGPVVGIDALLDGGEPLQAHAGIDVLGRQFGQPAVLVAVILDEDQVPDLQKTLAAAVDAAVGFSAGELLPTVVMQLRAGTAGTGLAHLPEVFLGPEAQHPFGGKIGHLGPQLGGLVVVGKDRGP